MLCMWKKVLCYWSQAEVSFQSASGLARRTRNVTQRVTSVMKSVTIVCQKLALKGNDDCTVHTFFVGPRLHVKNYLPNEIRSYWTDNTNIRIACT